MACKLLLVAACGAARHATMLASTCTHTACAHSSVIWLHSHSQAAENYLRRSGLRWTIVRPGGLKSEAAAEVGRLVTSGEDTLFGLDSDPGRAISRDTVRLVCLFCLHALHPAQLHLHALIAGDRHLRSPCLMRLSTAICMRAWHAGGRGAGGGAAAAAGGGQSDRDRVIPGRARAAGSRVVCGVRMADNAARCRRMERTC